MEQIKAWRPMTDYSKYSRSCCVTFQIDSSGFVVRSQESWQLNFFVCLLVFVGFYFPNNQPSSDLHLASISETAGTRPYAMLALLWAYFPLVLLVNQSSSMCWRTAGPLACKAANELFLQKAVGIEHVSCNQWVFLSDMLSKMEVFYGNLVYCLCVTTCTLRTTMWVCMVGDSTCLENEG